MLQTSYFIPHSPVLIPRIGKDHTEAISQTVGAYKKIKTALEKAKIDSIIVLSSHSPVESKTFNINFSPSYRLDLAEFGDLTSRQTWRPDVVSINQIAYQASSRFDINMITDEALDYGTSIPLHLLTQQIPAVKIIPITFGSLPLSEMYRFGQFLENECASLNKRFTVLATGDLSHRLAEESPTGFSPEAASFDSLVQNAFETQTFESLLETDSNLLNEVGQCGLRSLLVLAGAMHSKNAHARVYSYEASLGVGYLTGGFELS